MAHKRPAEENASSTVCQTPGCNRVAFGSHRYCCSQCKHSNGIVHGHRCGFRQETFREPSPPKQPMSSDLQLQNLKALVESCLPDLPVEERRKWLRDLLRSFHNDRYSALSGHHVCSQFLTGLLESQKYSCEFHSSIAAHTIYVRPLTHEKNMR